MLLLCVICSLVIGRLRGGSFRSLLALSFKGWPCYLTAFALQASINSVILHSYVQRYEQMVYISSFAILIIGSWLDRDVAWMPWVTSGLVLNALAIAANGGKMPVRAGAVDVLAERNQAATHVTFMSSRRFLFLGDVIRLPLNGGHYLLLSPGDILVALGAFLLIQHIMLAGPRDASTTPA